MGMISFKLLKSVKTDEHTKPDKGVKGDREV